MYEEIANIGTADTEEKLVTELFCDFCKKRNHTEENCRRKKAGANNPSGAGKTGGKRTCYRCGSEDHLARDCPEQVDQSAEITKVPSTLNIFPN